MAAPTFPGVEPTVESAGPENTLRVLKAKFGDGYEQRAADGINTQEIVWDVAWADLNLDDCDTITDFFVTQGGHSPFYWTPPNGSAVLWVCDTWSESDIGPSSKTIRAKWSRWYGAEE